MESRSEELVVEGRLESGFVGRLEGAFECSVVVEGEALMGSGSVAVGADIVASMEAMMECRDDMVG